MKLIFRNVYRQLQCIWDEMTGFVRSCGRAIQLDMWRKYVVTRYCQSLLSLWQKIVKTKVQHKSGGKRQAIKLLREVDSIITKGLLLNKASKNGIIVEEQNNGLEKFV